MKRVLGVIDEFREWFADHPLHHWLTDESDGVEPQTKLWAGLHYTVFVMGCSDMNRYHVSYDTDPRLDELRATLSRHASDDMTHARLFLRDFVTLDWDAQLDFTPSETLHWIYSSQATEPFRSQLALMIRLVAEAADPAVRHAVVAAIEATGNALFRATAQVARRYTDATGRELLYWGDHHLGLKDGHRIGDDGAFEDLWLDAGRHRDAVRRVARVFEIFDDRQYDLLLLAQRTISQGGFAYYRQRYAPPSPTTTDRACHPVDWPSTKVLHTSQAPIHQALQECVGELRNTCGRTEPADADISRAQERLSAVLLLSIGGAASAQQLHRYALPYPTPLDAQQRKVNRLVASLRPAAPTFYTDWASLGLDERLGWPTSRMLRFLYLDGLTRPQREVQATVTRHALQATDPVARYWVIRAVAELGAVRDAAWSPLARRVWEHTGRPLPFLTSGMGHAQPDLDADLQADAVEPPALAVSREAAGRITTAISEIHRVMTAEVTARHGALENPQTVLTGERQSSC